MRKWRNPALAPLSLLWLASFGLAGAFLGLSWAFLWLSNQCQYASEDLGNWLLVERRS